MPPFPIQRIQTNRGRKFFAYKIQEWLMDYCIKFRLIRPRSPHLNGKVERAQRTDLEEFYASANLQDPKLRNHLSEWQQFMIGNAFMDLLECHQLIDILL